MTTPTRHANVYTVAADALPDLRRRRRHRPHPGGRRSGPGHPDRAAAAAAAAGQVPGRARRRGRRGRGAGDRGADGGARPDRHGCVRAAAAALAAVPLPPTWIVGAAGAVRGCDRRGRSGRRVEPGGWRA